MHKFEFLIWILLLPLSACSNQRSDLLDDVLLIAADGSDAATMFFIEAVRDQPHNETALIALGDRMVASGQLLGDASRYETALRLAELSPDPRSKAAAILRARALMNLHRFREAGRILTTLRATSPAPVIDLLFADVLIEQGRFGEARAIYQDYAMQRPGALAHGRLARLHFESGEIQDAIRLNQAAVRAAHPRDTALQSWLLSEGARYALAAGDANAAEKLAHVAVARSASVRARFVFAQSTLASGDSNSALEQLSSLASTYPSPQVLWWLEDLYRDQGRVQAADAIAVRARQLGERIDPRGFAQWLIARQQDLPRARRLLEAELRQRKDPVTLSALAALEWAEGHPGRARIAVETALETGLPNPDLHHLAAAIFSDDEPRRASQHLALAHQLRYLARPGKPSLVPGRPRLTTLSPTAEFIGNPRATNALSN